jgi:hypothetical protein
MLNRGKFFRTAMASPRFKGCATAELPLNFRLSQWSQ